MKDKPLNEKVEKCEVDEGGSENNYDWVYWEDIKEAVEKLKKEIIDLSILESNSKLEFKAKFVDIIEAKINKIFGDFCTTKRSIK